MTTFHLPDLGEGLREAEVVLWHVGPGDHVVADQPMVAVETDKAVVEIPAPHSGYIGRLHAEPGDILDVGQPLVDFLDEANADPGAIVGELLASTDPRTDAPLPAATTPPGHVRATPAVRKRARQLGARLEDVVPTGPDGTITLSDLDSVDSTGSRGSPEPLRGVRRAMAANMTRAHAEVVPATVTEDADIGDWQPGTDVTLRLARAVAVACTSEPALNASYHGRDVGRTHNTPVDLGIAIDTDDGLFVPVLRDVDNRTSEDLRLGLDALKADVAARSVPPEQLKGQTITLSNFGTIGGRHASLVVVPPQVAIVGAGRIRPAVVVREDRPSVQPVLPISLTFDHRVVMGGEAARFLGALISDLELSS